MTRKRIVGFAGVGLATLGFIILIAGYGVAAGKWDDENCCKNKTCDIDNILPCDALCSFPYNYDAIMEDSKGCCYKVNDSPGIGMVIFGIVALATVALTSIILECGDKICCECCQKCTAIILGIQNILGLIFVIILFVIIAATESSTGACDDTTQYKLVGTQGIMMAGTVFLLLGTLCACIVTFIECCCDDSDSAGGATTST